jgi:hypothetical protein
MTKEKYVAVAYRTRGWRHAIWRGTDPIRKDDRDAIKAEREELERMGYKTVVVPMGHGVPIGFCFHADPISGKMEEKTCECK